MDSLQKSYQNIPIPILVLDDKHLINYINEYACSFLQCSKEELIGKTIYALPIFWPEQNSNKSTAEIITFSNNEAIKTTIKQTDGKNNWVRITSNSVCGEKKQTIICLEDITEEHQQSKKATSLSQQLNYITDNNFDYIVRLDITPPMPLEWPKDEQEKYLNEHAYIGRCNRKFAESIGFKSIQAVEESRIKYASTASYKRNFNEHAYIIENNFTVTNKIIKKTHHKKVRYAQYSCLPHITDNKLQSLLTSSHDATEFIEEKKTIEKNNKRYQSFINNSHDGVYRISISPPLDLSLSKDEQLNHILKYGKIIECSDTFATQNNISDKSKIINKSIEQAFGRNSSQIRNFKNEIVDAEYNVKNKYISLHLGDKTIHTITSIEHNITDGMLDELWGTQKDITEESIKNEQLKIIEERYNSYIVNSHDAFYRVEINPPLPLHLNHEKQIDHLLEHGVFAEASDKLIEGIKAKSKSSIIGSPLSIIPDDINAANSYTRLIVENSFSLLDKETPIKDLEDNSRWYSINIDSIKDEHFCYEYWGAHKDIHDKYEQVKQLEYQANHDTLTGLANRNKLYHKINDTIKDIKNHKIFSIMLIDLDRFKEINDTLGHHTGDNLLRQIGPRIENVLKDTNHLISRLGGDEFVILLLDTNKVKTKQLTKSIINSLKTNFELNGIKADVGASVGIAYYPDHGKNISQLMRCADVAMYQAKAESSGYKVYNISFDKHSRKRLTLNADLRLAISDENLELHYQPKVDLTSNTIIGFEGLLRWNHPTHGYISPADFIPIAESSDLIHELTDLVLRKGISQAAKWMSQGYDFRLALNLSARSLLDQQIIQKVSNELKTFSLPGKNIELEITESAIMTNPEIALQIIRKLSLLGIHLSIDDFGTGYSSLSYLKQLEVDEIKIDAAFVSNMLSNDQDEIIVNSTINLAHNLGMTVVAEGIESERVMEQLEIMGCNQGQGFHIAYPASAEDVELWLNNCKWKIKRIEEA